MRIIFHKRVPIFILGFIIGFSAPVSIVFFHYLLKESNLCCINTIPIIWNSNHNIRLYNNAKQYFFPKTKDVIKQSNSSISYDLPKLQVYKKWLEKQTVHISKVDMDYYLHGPKKLGSKRKNVRLESDWLKSQIHLTCVVFAEKIKLVESIWNTWGQHCNTLYFFTRKNKFLSQSIPIINIKLKFTSSWQYLCEILKYIWDSSKEKNDRLEWVIFIKDDMVVIPENLRLLLAPLNFNQTYYLGHPVILWGQTYNVAQAGYVLSSTSIKKLVEKFNSSEKCASSGKYWKMEDYYLGKHLNSLNVYPSDTRDSGLRGIFHGYPLTTLLWGVAKPSNYFTKAIYPLGPSCCSPVSVTFSVSEADKLYTLNYILYYLHIYQSLGTYGNKSAPTPIPDNEVWKAVLKEEFNIDNITQISSEKYYELWRSRYSEPEEFIAHNFKAVPSDPTVKQIKSTL